MNILEGIRVLDFTQAIAGPFATRVLAELGAEVIKIEPPQGDLVRAMAIVPGTDVSAMFNHGGAGKHSVCVDLKRQEGVDLVKRLVPTVDVVVENFAPGVIDRLGFGYNELKALKSDVIMCSVSAYGQYGEYASYVGADPVGQAMSGMVYTIGEPDGVPYLATNGIADTSTATHAALAIGMALVRRERQGVGAHIDIGMCDVMMAMDCVNIPLSAATNGAIDAKRSGPHSPAVSPFGVFRARDGHVLIEAWGEGEASLWGRLCKVMGRPELITDGDFASPEARLTNREKVTAVLEEWLDTFDGRDQALEFLYEARVVAAPVLSPAEAMRHRVATDRQMIQQVEYAKVPGFQMVAMPYKYDGEWCVPTRAPELGEHTRPVLQGLGMDDAEIDRLRDAGVVVIPG